MKQLGAIFWLQFGMPIVAKTHDFLFEAPCIFYFTLGTYGFLKMKSIRGVINYRKEIFL